MFISEDEAIKRLKGDSNLLKDGVGTIKKKERVKEVHEEKEPGRSKQDDEELKARADMDGQAEHVWEEPEFDEIKLPSFTQSPDSLDALEKVIALGHNGGSGRARYRGSREAQKALAESDALLGSTMTGALFGLSQPQAHAYGDGLQTPHYRDPLKGDKVIKEVRSHVERVKLDIAIKATSRLKRVVEAINGPRIDAVESPMDLARLGKDLALIVEKVTPRELLDPDRGNITVYRPEVAQTQEYNIVNINVGVKKAEELDAREKQFLARTLASDDAPPSDNPIELVLPK